MIVIDKVKMFREIVTEMADLYEKKNSNYGDSFGQLYDKLGPVSGLVPLHNKIDRATSLVKGGENHFESLEDTFKDLACYAIMNLIEMKSRAICYPDYDEAELYYIDEDEFEDYDDEDDESCDYDEYDDLDDEEDYDDYDDCIYEEDEIEDEEEVEEEIEEEDKVVEEEKNDSDVEDLVDYIKKVLNEFRTSEDPCAKCPQRPSTFAKLIGDGIPCQFCEHNPLKVTCVNLKL